MASKKKAAKPVKKAAPAKKPAPAKKAVAAKPAPAPKKAAVVAKKPAPAPKKAPVVAKKPAPAPTKSAAKPVQAKQPEPKKAVAPPPAPAPKPVEKKPEVLGVMSGKPIKLVSAPPPPVKKKVEPSKPTNVVIPEMKTKSTRKYEPEFTKSVLDQPGNIQTGPTMRYSDAELLEFKELIQKKLDQAKKELTYLQGLITRKDEMGGDETENRYMTMEDGSMSMEREQLAQMASRQINYTDHLEKALMRIENKTYGICRVTGKLIDKARLRAVPHATLSIEAKQMMNK
jgi:RNA polymerase-binding transcription factor DksA